MSKNAITSLALLKVNWDRHQRSYTDNFFPLAAECIRKSNPPVVVVRDLQDQMASEFGLRLPTNSIKVILERAKKYGYVKLENKVYLPNKELLAKLSIEETRRKVLEEHSSTVNSLIRFCQLTYRIEWTQVEAENALVAYLKEFDLDILIAATEGTALPEVSAKPTHAKYLVNAFVREIVKENSMAFSYFETIVKGHILAGALAYPDASLVSSKFKKTKVFFDTRVILNALGYGGLHYQNACRDLLKLLYDEGADLRCFRHTYDEVYGILDASARSYKSRGAIEFPAGLSLVFQGCSESDVLLAIATLERDIGRLRIEIEEKPAYIPEHQISEADLDAQLQKSIGYTKERAKVRDVDSLSAIYRLRKGNEYDHLETSRAFFVTTNTKLVRTACEFFQELQQSRSSAPICISDHHLTNILWLKRPALASELPRKQIIADAYAAMEPSPEFWRKFVAEVEKLNARGNISAGEYMILRNSLEIRAAVMDATLGDPEVIVEGTITEVLEAYNKNLKAEAEAKLLEAEQGRAEIAKELGAVDIRIEAFASSVAKWVSRSVLVLLFALLLVGAYASFQAPKLHSWVRYLVSGSFLLLLLYHVGDLCFGVNVRLTTRRVEEIVRSWLSAKLKKLFLDR